MPAGLAITAGPIDCAADGDGGDGCVRARVFACACARVCVRACVRAHACARVRVCTRACVHA